MRRASDAVLGKGQMLRFRARSADKGSMVSIVRPNASSEVRRRERESGQALVEFALILPLFLMIVVGIIQFGIGLNFWLDMQRIANQGARWAVVNEYPGCPRSGANVPCSPTLQEYLATSEVAQGENLDVHICFPSGVSTAGNPVRVKITQPLNFLSIVTFFTPGSGLNIDLTAEATMRLEQEPGRYTADPDTPEPGPC
jgi:hypothetical protein